MIALTATKVAIMVAKKATATLITLSTSHRHSTADQIIIPEAGQSWLTFDEKRFIEAANIMSDIFLSALVKTVPLQIGATSKSWIEFVNICGETTRLPWTVTIFVVFLVNSKWKSFTQLLKKRNFIKHWQDTDVRLLVIRAFNKSTRVQVYFFNIQKVFRFFSSSCQLLHHWQWFMYILCYSWMSYLQLRAIVVFDYRYNARENKLLWKVQKGKKRIYASWDGGVRR